MKIRKEVRKDEESSGAFDFSRIDGIYFRL
jgi:hypothetical protein